MAAALKLALPDCDAVMVAEPELRIVTVLPLTVATEVLELLKVTAKPELVVALKAKLASPNVFASSALNEMV